MSRNIFDEENQVSEYEMLNNVDYQETLQNQDIKISFDLNERDEEIVSEAMVRLEQARLYEMLIKHDMFDGVNANQTALKNVKKELKDYIVSRLEILLGIRPSEDTEPTRYNREDSSSSLPFDESELAFLKYFAKRGVEKAVNKEDVVKTSPNKIQTAPIQQNTGLKSLSIPNKQPQIQKQEAKMVEKKPSNPNRPLKKPSTVEEIAMDDLEQMRNRKSFDEMDQQEKEAEAARIAGKYKTSKRPPNAKPIPTAAQMEMAYIVNTNKVLSQDTNLGGDNLTGLIGSIINKNK